MAHLSTRHEHEQCGVLEYGQLVDEQLRGEAPAAEPVEMSFHPWRRELVRVSTHPAA